MNNVDAHEALVNLFTGPLTAVDIWIFIGFLGQSLFFMRFLVQWIVSEKNQRSTVPDIFWYFSLGGGIIVFAYVWHRQDPVLILGQGVGVIVYIRNIMLVRKARRQEAEAAAASVGEGQVK